jgi:putative pyruvate formate lyase activating enzyme
MHRQVGDLVLDDQGVAVRGLLVRHLVLPRGLAGTKGVVSFLVKEVSRNTYLNIMAQYHPCHHTFDFPELDRPLSGEEFAQAVKMAISCGLARLDGLHSASALGILPVPDEA